MAVATLFGVLIVLLFLGVPVGFALITAALESARAMLAIGSSPPISRW